MKLSSGVLRNVKITKDGCLDITVRFAGQPDPGYSTVDFHTLLLMWNDNHNIDIEITDAQSGV